MRAATYLNKSEASAYLHKLYDELIVIEGLDDTHPNFYSIINENLRNPISPDAVKKGYPRGNRMTYGKIEYIRIGNRPCFFKSKLKEWFILHYAPKLLHEAA